MISPELFEDQKLATVCRECRLFFIGLIIQSNDYGKLRGEPELVKSKMFPFDEDKDKIPAKEFLLQLSEIGVIQCYEINNEKYIKITNWTKYQTLTYKAKDEIPNPLTNTIKSLNKPLRDPYVEEKLSEVKRREEKLSEVYQPSSIEDLTNKFKFPEKDYKKEKERQIREAKEKGLLK